MFAIKKGLYRLRHAFFKGAAKLITFPNPELIVGQDSLQKMAQHMAAEGLSKVLVVTDANLRQLGLLDNLFHELGQAGIQYSIFDGVQPNPTIQNVEDAAQLYLAERCQGFVAFGGGSPMDCAKAAGCRIVKPKQSIPKMRGMFKVGKELPPFYAIPTTAGTGSETTAAAVISNPATHEKFAIIDLHIIPTMAVLDSALMVGLPPFITATTGMDALTHAIEAYIGVHGTPVTDENAEKATRMIFENLERAFQNGHDLETRTNMALASFYAGVAFTRASVGYVHAVAHNMGGLYGVAHGLANAVALPVVLERFGPSIFPKLARLAIAGGLGRPEESKKDLALRFISKIRELNQRMGIPSIISELKKEDIPLLANRALKEGNPAYPVPRIFQLADMEAIYNALLPS